MVNNEEYPEQAVPVNVAARCLRVPAAWLRGEIEAGRLPGLHAGRAILVHVPTVVDLLTARAAQAAGGVR